MKSFREIVLNYILINAVKKNTPINIPQLISLGADVNATDSEKTSLLMWASYYGQISNVEYLIKAGADINCINCDKWSALIFATIMGNSHIIIMLINAGANVNHTTQNGSNALIIAAGIVDDTYSIDILLKAGANINSYDYDMRRPLMVASRNGHTSSVKRLLTVPNIDVNAVDALFGRSALKMSIYNGHVSTVEALLEHHCIHTSVVAISNSDINLSGNGTSIDRLFNRWHLKQSLCYAAAGTHIRHISIETALAIGNLTAAEISQTRDWNGYTSLTNTIKSGNLKGVDILLDAGASLLVAGDLQGTSVGAYAIRHGYPLLGEQLYYKTLKEFCLKRPVFKRLRSEIVVGNRVPSVGRCLPRELVNYILEFVIKIELPPGF
jgi:ankyrin repeat protein